MSLADNSLETGVYNENGYWYEGLNPNYHVKFNNELWRIIGVFDDETHNNVKVHIKQIKQQTNYWK